MTPAAVELGRADYIVSANIGRTAQACRQAVMDSRRAIAWLAKQGYDSIGILGTSLALFALLTAAQSRGFARRHCNHISPFFADVVWHGLSRPTRERGLEGSIDLESLRHMWLPISPQVYLDRVRDKKTLLVYAKYDLTFPVDLLRCPGRRIPTPRHSARAGGPAVRTLFDGRHAVQIPRRVRAGEVPRQKFVTTEDTKKRP